MCLGQLSVKAGARWHGNDSIIAKNTFEIRGGPQLPCHQVGQHHSPIIHLCLYYYT